MKETRVDAGISKIKGKERIKGMKTESVVWCKSFFVNEQGGQ